MGTAWASTAAEPDTTANAAAITATAAAGATDRRAVAATGCDLLLAVGTTLTVSPICNMVAMAHQPGAEIIIVNAEPTPFDDLAAAVVRAPIGNALPEIVGEQ